MKEIILTDKQYEKLCDVLIEHSDRGPLGQGYNSKELDELIEVVTERRVATTCEPPKINPRGSNSNW